MQLLHAYESLPVNGHVSRSGNTVSPSNKTRTHGTDIATSNDTSAVSFGPPRAGNQPNELKSSPTKNPARTLSPKRLTAPRSAVCHDDVRHCLNLLQAVCTLVLEELVISPPSWRRLALS